MTYRPSYLDTPNIEINNALITFTNFKATSSIQGRIDKNIDEIDRYVPPHFAYRKDNVDSFLEDYTKDRDLNNINNHCEYYNQLPNDIRDTIEKDIRELVSDSSRIKKAKAQFLLLKGKAGTGKTHSICRFVDKEKHDYNVYLLFGSDFNSLNSLQEQICKKLSFPDGLVGLNDYLENTNSYAVVIIDALNEGGNDSFWKSELDILVNTLKKLKRIKLTVSVRMPFDKILFENGNDVWITHEIKGFSSSFPAVNKYLKKYEIDLKYADIYKNEFRNPLFLRIFCSAFNLLSPEEKANASRLDVYRHFLTLRNAKVCEIVDEDPHRTLVADYVRKLCSYSVFTGAVVL